MQVINTESNVMCDVDDTILMWDNPTINGIGKVPVEFAGETVYLTPHKYHVQLLKMYKQRGYSVFVWSANGVEHATRAVAALGIEEFVDFVMTKPAKHMDDSENPGAILGPRVYINDITKPQYVYLPYESGVGGVAGGILNGR
jgi:hypothetical protein